MTDLGQCEVKGCERQAVTVAIVTSTDFAGAANLCQHHYDLAARNAAHPVRDEAEKPVQKSRKQRKSKKG